MRTVCIALALLYGSAWACPDRPPHTERPADIVLLADIEADIVQDLRYAGSDNFLGRPVAGYAQARCWLTRPAAAALKRAHAELKRDGLGLKVFDCYRPQQAVDDFVRWAAGPRSPNADLYYPDIPQTQLIPQGYIAACSGHSRGSTVDLTIIYRDKQPSTGTGDQRGCQGGDADALDMGTGYDCFGKQSHTLGDYAVGIVRENRLRLKTLMEKHGFSNFPQEWWHYTFKAEPYPDTWFDFPLTTGSE